TLSIALSIPSVTIQATHCDNNTSHYIKNGSIASLSASLIAYGVNFMQEAFKTVQIVRDNNRNDDYRKLNQPIFIQLAVGLALIGTGILLGYKPTKKLFATLLSNDNKPKIKTPTNIK
ncbi:hypothetical protein LCGC14_1444970, partial [marine sediment metagenome]